MMVLSTNNSSVFKLNYKLILKIKDMTWLENENFTDKLEGMFVDISNGYGVEKRSMEISKNIVTIRFEAKPNTEISKFINAYKSSTSRVIKRIFSEGYNAKEFWSKGYLLLTIGEDFNYTEELIHKYI